MLVFRYLVDAEIDFIHSDADAVWVKNPIPEYFGMSSKFDLACSQGTVHPANCFENWGFVLCCGIFYVRSTEMTRNFVKEWVKKTFLRRDDQITLNHLLLDRSIEWEIGEFKEIVFEGYDKRMIHSPDVITGKNANTSVCVLPFEKFVRGPGHSSEEPFVVHVLGEEGLRKAGGWFLD